jgi:hypothetical protein
MNVPLTRRGWKIFDTDTDCEADTDADAECFLNTEHLFSGQPLMSVPLTRRRGKMFDSDTEADTDTDCEADTEADGIPHVEVSPAADC